MASNDNMTEGAVVASWSYYPSILLEEMSNNPKNLSQHNQSHGRNLNEIPPKHKSKKLPLYLLARSEDMESSKTD
jgi:hypothetical protein